MVTWAGEEERRWGEAIAGQAQGAAVLAPSTSLIELAAVLRKARMFVGSDTGPLHLAAAMGTRCVGLFGASLSGACGPYGNGHIGLQVAVDESPGRKKRGAANWAMRMIGVADVCQACDRILNEGRSGGDLAIRAA